MNKKITIFLILLIIFLTLPINVKAEGRLLNYYSGNKYLKLNKAEKICYMIGLLDMFYYLTSEDKPGFYELVVSEFENMTIEQIGAIFDKYLKEHPENWQHPCSWLFVQAIGILIFDL